MPDESSPASCQQKSTPKQPIMPPVPQEALDSLRDAQATLSTIEQGFLSMLAEDTSGATMRLLHGLERQVPSATVAMEAAIEDMEMELEDADGGTDTDALQGELEEARLTFKRRKVSLRSAKLKIVEKQNVAQKADRNALLGGQTLGEEELLARQQKKEKEDEDNKKVSAQAINKLQRMKAEMAAESARAAEALQVFSDSTSTLGSTNAKQENVSSGTDRAARLVGELARRERHDRQMMMAALLLFVLTVLYVIGKRLPFICRVIPCFMGGCGLSSPCNTPPTADADAMMHAEAADMAVQAESVVGAATQTDSIVGSSSDVVELAAVGEL
jgi:protein transport protein SEC20